MSSIIVSDFFTSDSKNGVLGLMLRLKIYKMRPYCKIQLGALLAWTTSWSLLVSHFPITWYFAGCLCSTFGEQNIGNDLQRLLRCPRKCSRNSMEGDGTRKELSHVGCLEIPCISVHHSLCRGSWTAWNAWCGYMGVERPGEHVIQPSTDRVGQGSHRRYFYLPLLSKLRGLSKCSCYNWLTQGTSRSLTYVVVLPCLVLKVPVRLASH